MNKQNLYFTKKEKDIPITYKRKKIVNPLFFN